MMQLVLKLENDHTLGKVYKTYVKEFLINYIWHVFEIVEQGGTKIEKIDSLNDYVYNNFEQARNLLYPVHEINLKRWAIRKARTMSLHDFVASDHWASKFKNNYSICS